MYILRNLSLEFKIRGDVIMSKSSLPVRSCVRVVLSVFLSFALLSASIPVSTYASIQAPPPRN